LARKKTPEQFIKVLDKEMREMLAGLKDFHMWAAKVAEGERRKGFESGHGPQGEKWPALKQSTIDKKAGKHHSTVTRRNKQGISGSGRSKRTQKSKTPTKPLMDRGVMAKGRVGANRKHGWLKLWESRSDSVWQGKSIAEIHDEGLGVPKRPHFGIYGAARLKIKLGFKRFVERFVKGVARG